MQTAIPEDGVKTINRKPRPDAARVIRKALNEHRFPQYFRELLVYKMEQEAASEYWIECAVHILTSAIDHGRGRASE